MRLEPLVLFFRQGDGSVNDCHLLPLHIKAQTIIQRPKMSPAMSAGSWTDGAEWADERPQIGGRRSSALSGQTGYLRLPPASVRMRAPQRSIPFPLCMQSSKPAASSTASPAAT